MTLSNGTSNDANDVLNIYHHGGNVLIGKNGTIFIPVIINNVSGTRNVYLYLYGKKAGASNTSFTHGAPKHDHTSHTHLFRSSQVSAQGFAGALGFVGQMSSDTGGESTHSEGLDDTNVPQAVQIWIDGTEYTVTIDDPNAKGATMYDGTNDDWGIDGTTEWNTGRLNLSSLISWTAGEHSILLVETGGTGGTIIFHLSINAGF